MPIFPYTLLQRKRNILWDSGFRLGLTGPIHSHKITMIPDHFVQPLLRPREKLQLMHDEDFPWN